MTFMNGALLRQRRAVVRVASFSTAVLDGGIIRWAAWTRKFSTAFAGGWRNRLLLRV